MPKLTDKQLQMRKLEMAARSRASVAKKELVQFRLEADKIVKLFEIAAENETHMGTMLREWVSERIAHEQAKVSPRRGQQARSTSSTNADLFVKERISDFYGNANDRLDVLEKRIAKLETKSKEARGK